MKKQPAKHREGTAGMLLFVFSLILYMGRWLLPFYAALECWVGDLAKGAAAVLAWLVCMFIYAQCNLSRYLRDVK